ncbi:flagellar hook-associated protein 3 [Massilia sp. Dwa41.01b]|uniref:flagellar hook-associated protein FlgL n=1 Tax=unclassified Massilia TaxID=2609279 RepID=UPI0016034FDF|nr:MULTISPECIES: flagellar hook-associated protein FlgL [unclassified Massilia]QNA90088.1 flagellar hook-associated protein 3 [Massilia sp. Dwa41.01b]QNB00978.1 flagellar hook-associated protein 3 [Massilia sp. Se16.2.3]
MRISTKSIYENATTQLNTLQSNMARTQTQLATNKRMLTAADDPIASARALEVTQSQSLNTQYAANRSNANSSLSLVEGALSDAGDLLMDVQTLVVQAGNGTLSKSDRGMIATEIEARMHDLLGVANTSDGSGGYLFSGYRGTTVPFIQTDSGASYQGDQGQRKLQVGSSRSIAISDSGSSIFENNRTGNGSYQTSMVDGNQGGAVATSGSVSDPSKLTGHNYTLEFKVSGTPAVTTYSVTDTNTNTAVLANQPYETGKQIAFDGTSFAITGQPADGDKFAVKPSEKESIFTTMTNLVKALRDSGETTNGLATLSNKLTTASEGLKSSLDNILTVRASVGSRMKELDYLEDSGSDLNIQYSATLSKLQDLDMVKAISQYATQQQTLEAAQKSFKTMSGLSLFNYIG